MQIDEIELYEFRYEKYGEHIVAMKSKNGGAGIQLFDAVNLFSKNNTRAEYDSVKDEAAKFAKDFVARFNGEKSNG